MFEDPYHDPDPYEGKSEWSTKRILIRILMWPLCLAFIGFGVYIIINSPDKNLRTGIGLITIPGIYIIIDLKIILTKK
jgi:hypothetical protein